MLLLFPFSAKAQRNKIYSDSIASLQVVMNDNWQEMPIIKLNTDDIINIDFDDFTHSYHRYAYKIEHCDADCLYHKAFSPVEEQHAYALLQATSDACMAKLYLSKGNIAAARRKAVQLLKALQVLEVAQ